MKKIRIIIITAVLIFVLASPVSADEILDDLREKADLSSLTEELPEELAESGALNELDAADGNLFSVLLKRLLSMLGVGLGESAGFFAGLMSLSVLCALLGAVGESMASGTVKMTFGYVSVLVLSLYSYNCVSELFDLSVGYMRQINIYVSAVMPSLSVLTAVGGGGASAVVQNAGVTAGISLLETVIGGILAPLVRFSFAFALIGGVGNFGLSGFARGIRRIATVGISLVMTLLSALLFFQNSFASAADGVAVKAVRFASASFIPVIGSMISEAAGTIGGSIKYLKSTAGLFCIAAVLFLIAVPIIRLIIHKLIFGCAAFACDLLGLTSQGQLLREIKETLNILLVLAIASGVFFIIALTVFVRTGSAI